MGKSLWLRSCMLGGHGSSDLHTHLKEVHLREVVVCGWEGAFWYQLGAGSGLRVDRGYVIVRVFCLHEKRRSLLSRELQKILDH